MEAVRSLVRPASRRPTARPGRLDVYWFPAVVGGGWGDIAEVIDAGRTLERAGFPGVLYRARGRALPASVDGPWDWSGVARPPRIVPRAKRALTLCANWGVGAAADRPGRLGRGGPWGSEAAEVERTYGVSNTLHVSLEEFARTLPSREENDERWREGGARARDRNRRRGGAKFRREAAEFHVAFRRFREFDRPNLLHLFQGFAPSVGFVREFPEAVQVGPVWPVQGEETRRSPAERRPREWVWYASPSSSERLVAAVDRGLQGTPIDRIRVRSPRAVAFPTGSGIEWVGESPLEPTLWTSRFRSASLRIVTGSRTLLEALRLGGPFLYFNGVLGRGARTHRHRPEKIRSLLVVWRRDGVWPDLCRDLADFSRARRVSEVVRSAAGDPAWAGRFPQGWRPSGYPSDRADGGEFLARVATAFAEESEGSEALVGALRAGRRLPTNE